MEELAKKILYQVYVDQTKSNIKKVVEILESDSSNKDTEICDTLDIGRRYNRAEIRKVLSN